MLIVSEAWRAAYPGAAAAALVIRNAVNPTGHPGLERRRAELEGQLRARFTDREGLRSLPAQRAYEAYFKRFRKTYHVFLQLESVAVKGKPIPAAGALVEALFMAELKDLLLTAGHDLATVRAPVALGVAGGEERYVMYNGQEQTLKAGDMMICDTEGVISCVLYGPDRRTRITPETRDVLYTTYAPPGIGAEAVRQHLHDLWRYVALVAPGAGVETLEVHAAE